MTELDLLKFNILPNNLWLLWPIGKKGVWKHCWEKEKMLPPPTCFLSFPKQISLFASHLFCPLHNAFNLDQSRIMMFDQLTHYQMTNFGLFQTERVCRRQFQIWRKWHKVIQMGRKHCGKRRNCSLRAISPFPTVFSKGLFPRGVKRRHCVGMG